MSRSGMSKTAVAVFVYVLSSGIQAATVFVENFGFEDNIVPDGNFQVFQPSGWDLFDPNGITGGGNSVGVINGNNSEFFPGGVTEGNNAALVFLANAATTGTLMGLSQTLTSTLQANTTYSLSVDIGNIASGTGAPPSDQFGFFNLAGFPGYQVQLLAGGVLLAQDDNSLFGTIDEGEFATSSFQFSSGGSHIALGQELEIRLINLNLPGTAIEPGIEVDFDNVRLDATAVPVPPALLLFASAIVCLGTFKRKKSMAS